MRSKSLTLNMVKIAKQEATVLPSRMLSSRDRAHSRAHMTAHVCLGWWQQYQMGHKTDRQRSTLMALRMLRLTR